MVKSQYSQEKTDIIKTIQERQKTKIKCIDNKNQRERD